LSIRILVISVANPILIGVYSDTKLIDTISQEGKTSDVLPIIFHNLLKEYNIKEILYANGPGSFMAIKVAYIFLKTLSITNDIPLKAMDAFSFNNNSPIKALGKKYFFKNKDGSISLQFLEKDTIIENFILPIMLEEHIGYSNTLPSYNLPAVN